MTDDFQPIRPKSVRLSHVEAPPPARAAGAPSRWTVPAVLAAAAASLALVFVVAPRYIESTPTPPVPGAQVPAASAPTPAPPLAPAPGSTPVAAIPGSTPGSTPVAGTPTEPGPFEQLQRDQARTAAQSALSRFVELQLQLEQNLHVGDWGGAALDRAKDQAVAGDEAFARDDYPAAMASYQAAAGDLEALIAEGRRILEESLLDGTAELERRDAGAATSAFARAASVAPEDPRVTSGASRAERLPRVNELLLAGRNQELAGDWNTALATLREARRIDPDTSGLAEALARVEAGAARSRLQNVISAAFAHLDAGRYEDARTAFQEALRIDPRNAAAQGGLEQVDRRAELTRLERLHQDADRALAEERWGDAEALYAEALELDPNIQFAITGRAQASERQRATAALTAIIEEPDRLSSERAYADARQALAAAEVIAPRGPGLEARIGQVRGILEVYGKPVPVLLRSDNATRITVSTVGPLGTFTEKELVLRPGAYTLVGSRDGCRDVRERIVVRPDMAPVDIRCVEAL